MIYLPVSIHFTSILILPCRQAKEGKRTSLAEILLKKYYRLEWFFIFEFYIPIFINAVNGK
jgi:hypothetical protein